MNKTIMKYLKFVGNMAIVIIVFYLMYKYYEKLKIELGGFAELFKWMFYYFLIKLFIIPLFNKWKYYHILFKIVDFPSSLHSLILKPYIKIFFQIIESHYQRLHLCDRFPKRAGKVIDKLRSTIKPYLDNVGIDVIKRNSIASAVDTQNIYGKNFWESILEIALIHSQDFIDECSSSL